MCFRNNKSLFKATNWLFTVIHLAFLLACVFTVVLRDDDNPLTLYYQIDLTHGQVLDVYPIYISLFTHTAGMLFHFVFALSGSTIVDHYFSYNYTNPLRWILQFVVDGSTLVGLMLIHGFHTIDTVILVMVLYASTLGYCYLQDQYLNNGEQFQPDREPHFFAIPIYFVMILLIIAKSSEHINDEASIRIAIVTLVSLFQTLVMFVLQRIHIKYQYRDEVEHRHSIVEDEDEFTDTEEERALENVVNSKHTDRVDMILDEIRRGVKYEGFYYINSVLFEMTITWIIISITRSDQVLH